VNGVAINSSINIFTKQPDEIIPISVDYVLLLNDTETISSLSVSAVDESGESATSTIIYNSVIDGDVCKAVCKSGTDGSRYKITFKATTSEGNIYEEDVFMKVYET
jgi:hypothetical protein